MERYLGIIKIFNIVAAVIIVIGVAALGWLLIDRAREARASRDVVETGLIALPAGFTIAEMAATGEFLFLLVTDEAGLNLHGVGLVWGPDGQRYAVAVLAHGWGGYDDAATAIDELNAVGGAISAQLAAV